MRTEDFSPASDFRSGWRYIRQLTLPNGVFVIRYNGRVLDDDVANSVVAFVLIFILSFSAVAVSLSLMGLQPVTALSAAAAAIANVGLGLGPEIGPSGTYADLPDSAKWVLSFGMLLGRPDFYGIGDVLTELLATLNRRRDLFGRLRSRRTFRVRPATPTCDFRPRILCMPRMDGTRNKTIRLEKASPQPITTMGMRNCA